ncbi:glycosyltransferase family 4 protein [Candidatus Woesearchaeota archaeon]|nr:glycosyltransferase family 4 protein [Candidatus Woesearchaeota archaeon]
MKVIQYNDIYHHVGGAESHFLRISECLGKKGHEVFIFSFADKPIHDKHRFINKKKRKGLIGRFIAGNVFNLKTYLLFRKALKEINPDIIHLNQNQNQTYSILLAARKSKMPIVQTVHDYSLLCPILYYLPTGKLCPNKRLALKCLKQGCMPAHHYVGFLLTHGIKRFMIKKTVDCFLCPSKKLKEYLEKDGFRNVIHLPYFLDLKKWKFKPERDDRRNILFVGRFSKTKGLIVLVKAMAIVTSKYPDTRLTVVGEGDDREEIDALVKELGIRKNICFSGRIENDKLERFYHDANVFVMPSLLMEQFGIGGIEAMACGTPCIGTNVGGIPEWCIHGKTGFIVKPGDSKELAGRIMDIFKNKKLATRLAVEGRKLVEKNHGVKAHIARLEKIYKSMMQNIRE